MKKTLTGLAVSALLASSLIPALAATGHAGHKAPAKRPAARKVISAICPVMKSKIPDITKASGKSVYKGKTYYFCCAGCKPEFDKDPAKYVRKR